MNLIIDTVDLAQKTNVLTESSEKGKNYYVEGVFAQAELENRNLRTYPKAVLEKAIAAYLPTIAARRGLGELNHPPHPNVNPERASHLIESLTWSGNNVMGRAKILTSLPMGSIVKGLIDEGVSFGVSTRGMGAVSESGGKKTVLPGFMMNAIDMVSDPSGIDCWVDGLLENKQWVYESATGNWVAVAEQAKKVIQSLTVKQVAEQKAILFSNFLKSIK